MIESAKGRQRRDRRPYPSAVAVIRAPAAVHHECCCGLVHSRRARSCCLQFSVVAGRAQAVPRSPLRPQRRRPCAGRTRLPPCMPFLHSIPNLPPPIAPTEAPAVRGQNETPRVYAVAALNATLRALPTTRSKVVGTLKRGAPVVEIDRRDGFIKSRGSGDIEGWISSDILIEMSDLTRLQSSSTSDYIAARERFTPIERLTEHLDRMSPQVRSLLS